MFRELMSKYLMKVSIGFLILASIFVGSGPCVMGMQSKKS